MNALLPVLISLISGVTLTIQPLANGRLSQVLGGVALAAAVSAAVTSLTGIMLGASTVGLSGFQNLERVPWWAWLGGFLGLPSLMGMAWALPRLGAAPVMVLIVLGQLVTALAIDALGLSVQGGSVTTQRVIGVVVVTLGVWIVLRDGS